MVTKRISNIIVLTIVIGLVIFYSWEGYRNKIIIQKDIKFTNGEITDCKVALHGFVWISYSFIYNEKEYKKQLYKDIDFPSRGYFIHKSFPVVFSEKDPDTNEMLLFPEDFKKYALQYPDSLRWVKDLSGVK